MASQAETFSAVLKMPRRTVALHVALSLAVAGALVVLVVARDFRFLPEWLLWAGAGFAAFNAVSTLWYRRSAARRR